jgi:hypothetical protein
MRKGKDQDVCSKHFLGAFAKFSKNFAAFTEINRDVSENDFFHDDAFVDFFESGIERRLDTPVMTVRGLDDMENTLTG